MISRLVRLIGLLLCGLVLAGCVTPAPTTTAYQSKAQMSAEAALSALRTALLAQHTHQRGRLPGPYLETMLVDAEETLGSVQRTFDSVQPPATAEADALRDSLDPLLQEADSGVTELRIAARRGQDEDLARIAGDLTAVADQLDDFSRQHSR